MLDQPNNGEKLENVAEEITGPCPFEGVVPAPSPRRSRGVG